MKKFFALLVALSAMSVVSVAAQASPQSDLKAFQGYFKKRFPDVPLAAYANGAYALNANARAQWKSIMLFPPYEFELAKGKKLWNTPFKDGKTYASCFRNGGVDIAQHYPYWDKRTHEVRTIEMDINSCRKRNGEAPFKDLTQGPIAELTAYMKSLSRGKPVSINLSSPGMLKAYENGRKFFWARRGQLNFSCATCHVDNAGKYIRGNVLSAALGHGLGFPAYRAKFGHLITLDKRYMGCNKKVRAAPFKPQSVEYRDLEVYETYMDTGLPLEAPSYRP
ncbi:MAG: sulfur oxidation c-type cytochrome SoxA [Gammaproteobacteria bacterium]|nr:sulfur oxidation c-type cytochrome SoxA [Gammaproteobacteria bacterium]